MNPLSGVLTEAWQMYRAHAWHLLAIAFIIYVAAAVIAPFLALVVTLIYYRLATGTGATENGPGPATI